MFRKFLPVLLVAAFAPGAQASSPSDDAAIARAIALDRYGQYRLETPEGDFAGFRSPQIAPLPEAGSGMMVKQEVGVRLDAAAPAQLTQSERDSGIRHRQSFRFYASRVRQTDGVAGWSRWVDSARTPVFACTVTLSGSGSEADCFDAHFAGPAWVPFRPALAALPPRS